MFAPLRGKRWWWYFSKLAGKVYVCHVSILLKSSLAFIVSKGLFVLLHRETFLFLQQYITYYIHCEGKYYVVQQQCRHICGHAVSLPSYYYLSCIDAKDISSFKTMYTYQGVCSLQDIFSYTYIYKTFNIILFVRDGIKDCYCQLNAINH